MPNFAVTEFSNPFKIHPPFTHSFSLLLLLLVYYTTRTSVPGGVVGYNGMGSKFFHSPLAHACIFHSSFLPPLGGKVAEINGGIRQMSRFDLHQNAKYPCFWRWVEHCANASVVLL